MAFLSGHREWRPRSSVLGALWGTCSLAGATTLKQTKGPTFFAPTFSEAPLCAGCGRPQSEEAWALALSFRRCPRELDRVAGGLGHPSASALSLFGQVAHSRALAKC